MMCKEGVGYARELTLPEEVMFSIKFKGTLQVKKIYLWKPKTLQESIENS